MYSPFQDILHTNAIPMDAECDSIHALLRGPRKEVSLVDEASQKRAKLEEFIDAHLALVSPFRRLPDDIGPSYWAAYAGRGAHWRSRPTLVGVDAHCSVNTEGRRVARRSGTVPLDISLFYSRMAPSSFDISSMMSPIIAVSRRWRKYKSSRTFVSGFVPEDTPLLQSIAFKNDAESSLKSAISNVSAPPIINGPISWRSLNHFTVYSILCDDALRILAQCSALETCQLVLRTAHEVLGSPLHPQNIPLPLLHHLSITHSGFGPAGITLGALLPPTGHLECLEINYDAPDWEGTAGRNRDRDPQFLAHLTPPLGGAGPILCPRLRNLTLKQFKAVSDDTLLDFVRSRTGVRLEALRESTGLDIAQLSLFACSLQRSPQRDVRADFRRTGCVTNLTYQQDSAVLYSPLEGLDD
ncbi:hypothetical protein B0H14DRAFT_3048208 [Mycena olivaceomarginata]|nr:hypothetical protein B0H14DRAFT_3048208 [Mycena olivaceomarginata]